MASDRLGARRSGPLVVAEPGVAPTAAEERVSVASNWTLVWWRFRKHRLAMASAAVLLVLYAVVLCPDFFSTQDPELTEARLAFIPVQRSASSTGGRWSPWVPGDRREAQPHDPAHGVAGRPERRRSRVRLFVARLPVPRARADPDRPALPRAGATSSGASACTSWAPTGSAAISGRG